MPRARNPNRDRAKEIWLADTNIPLKKIAEIIGEPEGAVRKWKCTDHWEQIQKERSKNAPKKRGAPKGNKNAKGKTTGAPKGNKNAEKHGGYSAVYWDTLDEHEKSCIEDMPEDAETLLLDQIRLLTIRERRLLEAINYYRRQCTGEKSTYQITRSINTVKTNKVFQSKEKKEIYEKLAQEKINGGKISYLYDEVQVSQQTESVYDAIQRLERELSTVQNSKTRAIESLERLRIERQKLESDENDGVVDEWASAVADTMDVNDE